MTDFAETLTDRKGEVILLGRAEVTSLVEEAVWLEEVGVRPHGGVVVYLINVGQHDGVSGKSVAGQLRLLHKHVRDSQRC